VYHGHLAHQIRTDERCSQHKAGAARVVAVSLAAVLLSLETAQREIQLAIKAYLKADPALKAKQQRLLSVPGIGRQTVLQVLVLLARWETLTEGTGRAKGLVAYTGLDPKTHDSGSSAHKPARISRMSNRQMRRRLYLAAFGGVRARGGPLRDFYGRLVGRGKAKGRSAAAGLAPIRSDGRPPALETKPESRLPPLRAPAPARWPVPAPAPARAAPPSAR